MQLKQMKQSNDLSPGLESRGLSATIIESILACRCDDVFRYLGCHQISHDTYSIRGVFPNATQAYLLDGDNHIITSMVAWRDSCFFSVEATSEQIKNYAFRVEYDNFQHDIEDPYSFRSTLSQEDLYFFAEGNFDQAYRILGAHLIEIDGIRGVRFAVWAPNAQCVSVIGEFNQWDGRTHMMRKLIPSGVWEIFIPNISSGVCYKFEVHDQHGKLLPHKSDPFAFFSEQSPGKSSIVSDLSSYEWGDQGWQEHKKNHTKNTAPISIYEVHLASWKRVPEDGNRYLNYQELAADLIPYVKSMGFTHLQLMPMSEFPFDGSWGYQPIGLYSVTSRFGPLNDFKYFVDQCHQNNIAVLIDWVPGHFPTDEHGLGSFDGTPLYEHADERQGFHPDWNTYIYNFGRREVRSFLLSNALFWLDEFHIDGLRVDAVASMLYLDYSRNPGEWLPNINGGRENLDAIDFIRLVNERAYEKFPDCMMVAEESTAWPGVSKPTYDGGLGFGYKWNMGWMNDTLSYMSKDPIYRQHHHHDMTFSLCYAFSEHFVLALSHDEVVHGKRSLLAKMPGDCWQQFANLRAFYGFMWAHPGKKLLFMGGEFAQGPEWDHDTSLAWHQLHINEHKGVQTLVKDLNNVYQSHPALFDGDANFESFEWVEADDHHNSVFAFIRRSVNQSFEDNGDLIIISNFTPTTHQSFRVGVNESGQYKEILNTDDQKYGGSNIKNIELIKSHWHAWNRRENSIEIQLPPLATVFIERVK